VVHGHRVGRRSAGLQGKPEEGTVLISFSRRQCRGQLPADRSRTTAGGSNYERIIDKALARQGLIAAAAERSGSIAPSVHRLIFQAGLHHRRMMITEHAGRGVGLDAVGNLVRE
jgi:chemotaxis protein histidine kinase CheA